MTEAYEDLSLSFPLPDPSLLWVILRGPVGLFNAACRTKRAQKPLRHPNKTKKIPSTKYFQIGVSVTKCALAHLNSPIAQQLQLGVKLTLHECVEGARGRQVGGDGDVLFVGALRLDADRAVAVCAVAAHSARRVSDVCQSAVAVIPARKRMDERKGKKRGACHPELCMNRHYSRFLNSAEA